MGWGAVMTWLFSYWMGKMVYLIRYTALLSHPNIGKERHKCQTQET